MKDLAGTIILLIMMAVVVLPVTWLWCLGVENARKYYAEHPDAKPEVWPVIVLFLLLSTSLMASPPPTPTPDKAVQSYLVTISTNTTPFNNFRWAVSIGCVHFTWHQARYVDQNTIAVQFKSAYADLKCIPGYVTAVVMTKTEIQYYFAPGRIKIQYAQLTPTPTQQHQ